jgi:hypothetical protein
VEIVVHFRVVNKLVGNVNRFAWEMFYSFIRKGDGTLDTPAKAKVLFFMNGGEGELKIQSAPVL